MHMYVLQSYSGVQVLAILEFLWEYSKVSVSCQNFKNHSKIGISEDHEMHFSLRVSENLGQSFIFAKWKKVIIFNFFRHPVLIPEAVKIQVWKGWIFNSRKHYKHRGFGASACLGLNPSRLRRRKEKNTKLGTVFAARCAFQKSLFWAYYMV